MKLISAIFSSLMLFACCQSASAATFTQKNPNAFVPENVVKAFEQGSATFTDATNWVLGTSKTQDQIANELKTKGACSFVFRADGPDNKKEYTNDKGQRAWESHTRTVIVKTCPHGVVSIKTENYNAGQNIQSKNDYATVLSEKDSKYSKRTKNGKSCCVHDGKDVQFDENL